MRLCWVFVVVAVLTVLTGVLLSGDGAGSGEIVLSFGGSHGVNRNDLPVIGVWTVGLVAAALLLLPGSAARRSVAWTAVAASTALLVILLLGLGPGAEETRLSIARHHGLNLRGVLLTLTWLMGAYAILRLHKDY